MFSIFTTLALSVSASEELLTTTTVLVPAGKLSPFWIRPKKIEDQPEAIRVESFRIMVYPVTNREFALFLNRKPEWQRSKVRRLFADQHYLSQFKDKATIIDSSRLKSPATYVSWFAARAYCEDLGMRLPTLSEWEYVAIANEKQSDASKDPKFLSQILDWYSQPENKNGLASIGLKNANVYGVHDLHGLIWEWVDDFNSNMITGESRSDGGLDKNLFCGAGGMSGADKENYAAFMRFAFRSSIKGSSTTWNLGFRCVKEVSN